MVSLDSVLRQVEADGLLLLLPITIIEGPIATVIAAYAASLGFFSITSVYLVAVLGDLIGDALLYAVGRHGQGMIPARWQIRLGLNRRRMTALAGHFRDRGGRTLIIAKLTHSAGAAVLMAAGAARMPFGAFLWFNLLGTLPKSAFFAAVGFTLGAAYASIDSWIARGSLLLIVVIMLAGIGWYWRKAE